MSQSTTTLRSNLFSKNWSISTPSHPGVRFPRIIPARIDEYIPIVINQDNNKYQDSKDTVWDDAAIMEAGERLRKAYEEAPERQGSLQCFVEVDGKVVGYGGIWVVGEEGSKRGVVGLVLNEEGRGKGLGKLTVRVLAQLCFDMGMGVSLGTMNANGPMRGVMKSLGVEEKVEITELPGRGIVSELAYRIKKQDWEDFKLDIEFEEVGSS